jgi:choline kinase
LNRTGVILAAGLGSRIREDFKDNRLIKPLTSVDGLILLLRTIHSLEKADCRQIVIVLGYQAKRIKDYVTSHYSGNRRLQFAINHRYHLQNGLSVLCARPFVGKEFILTMSDHILDDQIMAMVRNQHPPDGGLVLCADYKLGSIFDLDDATKVLSEDGYIKSIGKGLDQYNCIDTGVFIATTGLIDAIEKIYMESGDASLSQGVQAIADIGLAKVLNIKEAFWQDVDNLDMLLHAEKLLSRHEREPKRSDLL